MCGRFTIGGESEALLKQFGLDEEARGVWEALTPRYNVAPTQVVPVVRPTEEEGEGGDRRRVLTPMRWGLVPSWAEDMKIGSRLINARVESVETKPSFRSAFRRRRCLVPATGFYEWASAAKGKKQPWLLRGRGGDVFAFAGLFERWRPPSVEGKEESGLLLSFTIVTGPANDLAGRIHDRMPVILPKSSYEAWLDPATPRERLRALMAPYLSSDMEAFRVSTLVNSPRNEDPACIRPLAQPN